MNNQGQVTEAIEEVVHHLTDKELTEMVAKNIGYLKSRDTKVTIQNVTLNLAFYGGAVLLFLGLMGAVHININVGSKNKTTA